MISLGSELLSPTNSVSNSASYSVDAGLVSQEGNPVLPLDFPQTCVNARETHFPGGARQVPQGHITAEQMVTDCYGDCLALSSVLSSSHMACPLFSPTPPQQNLVLLSSTPKILLNPNSERFNY